jgi:hypothetical protein
MMDTTDVAPEPPVPPPKGSVAKPRPSWRPSYARSLWSGAKAGFWVIALLLSPIFVILMIVGFIPTAFGLGAGRGLGVILWVNYGLASPFVGGLFGAIYGAPIALIGCLILRLIGPFWAARLRAAFKRPIHLTPWRRSWEISLETPSWYLWPRRLLWWAGLPTLVLCVIGFGVGVYAGRFVDRRLADAMAATERAYPPWRIDDLMAAREAVPDAENSAIVVAEVVSMLPQNWPGQPWPGPGMQKLPPDEIELAHERIGMTATNVQLDDETADTLAEALSEYSDAVDLARTVADYSRGRHELELAPMPYETLLPETQASRTAARLLMADAAIRAQDGDIDGALDSSRAILGVARSIGDEPFLISGLVRVAIGNVALTSARRVLAQGEPSDATLAKLQDVVLDELAQPILLQGVRGERAALDELIRRIRDAEISIESLADNRKPNEPIPPVSPWGKLSFDNQRALSLEWMNELEAFVKLRPMMRPPRFRAWEAEIIRVAKSRFERHVSTIPMLMMPAINAAEQAQSRYQSELGAMAILLAAERHRRKTGDWPASIAAIDPAFLAPPPVDPFTDEPYRLERRDGQFLVHSIGPNLKDEHGAYEPRKLMQGGPDDFGTGAWDLPLRRRPPAD